VKKIVENGGSKTVTSSRLALFCPATLSRPYQFQDNPA